MDDIQETAQPKTNRTGIIIAAVIALLLLAGLIFGIYKLATSNVETTGQVRDIFIIVLALESLLLGIALIVLIIQVAILANLVQNEVKPILESTRETVSTVKGTSKFISEKAVQPIITAGSFMAGFRKLFEIIGFVKRKN